MSTLALAAPPTAAEWITLGQAAGRLGVSRGVVRRLIADGALTVRRVGCWSRVMSAEIDALMERSTTPATAG